MTDRHLRRIFARRHGVTPVAWLGTQRLLLAKQLLTDTSLPVTQVALASGFGSLRRFNAAFAERYRLSPSALRREGAAEPGALRLAWRPPYDIDGLLGFVARRAVPGQEQVDGLVLRRTLAVQHQGQTASWQLPAGSRPASTPAPAASCTWPPRPRCGRHWAGCCSGCAMPSTWTPTRR